MKKKISFLTASISVLLFSSTVSAQSVSLDTYSPVQLTNSPLISTGGISTNAVAKYGGAGTFYDVSTKAFARSEDFSTKIEHTKGISTQISRSVASESFAELSIGGETELTIIGQTVSASAEVKAGVKKTVTTTMTWTVEADQPTGNYLVSSGKETMKTNGYIETANSGGVVTSRKFVNAYYTVRPYSSAKKI